MQVDEIMKEALQQDCDRYAPGVEIIAVRLTKPRIPDSITGNFEAMERERTKVTIAEERERVIIKEAEIERRRAVMQVTQTIHHFSYLAGFGMATSGGHSLRVAVTCKNGGTTVAFNLHAHCSASAARDVLLLQAEKEAETSRIFMDQRLAEKEAELKQKLIENEIIVSKQKALADAETYR